MRDPEEGRRDAGAVNPEHGTGGDMKLKSFLFMSDQDRSYFVKEEFDEYFFEKSITIIRISIILGLIIYLSSLVSDEYMLVESKSLIFFFRTIIPPFHFVCFLLTYTKFFKRHSQLVLFIEYCFFCNLGMVMVNFGAAPGELGYYYYRFGSLLYIIYVIVMARLRVKLAIIATVLHIIAIECITVYRCYPFNDHNDIAISFHISMLIVSLFLQTVFFAVLLENYLIKDYINQKKLKELDNLKSQFFANISHELRTPLTLMLSPVKEALKESPLDKSDLEMIERNGSNLLSLINDLLDVSRITAGRMKLRAVRTDMGALLRRCCAEVESAAKLKGISLTCALPERPVELYVDNRIMQVLSNLFSNSFKFTEPGGGIGIAMSTDDLGAVITFGDTGCGIPADKLGAVFDRFTQADTSSTRRYEGTGIGLSIVRELVELHGGSVSVESRYAGDFPEDHGTVFTVRIPRGKEHFRSRADVEILEEDDARFAPGAGVSMPHVRGLTVEADRPAPPESFNGEKPSLLVVEDNADMRSMLHGMLAGMYNVFTAANGFEALGLLDGNANIDLVLSDIMMPGMDGHELLERIRSDSRLEGLPVVFLTARADQAMKIEGLDLGAIDYVTKPFSADELMLRIRNQMTLKIMRNRLVEANKRLYAQLRAGSGGDGTTVTSTTERKLERVMEFIKENFTFNISREGLAAAVDMSPDHLSRSFGKYTGRRIDAYINELRIEEAKRQLAATDKTVIRIAFDTGFETIRSFNRVFSEAEGMSPTKYREECRAQGGFVPAPAVS